MMEAARRGRFNLVKAMTDVKADLAALDSESSSLLLHAAPGLDGTVTSGGAVKIFTEFLHLGQDPHTVNSSGRSAFHSAICEQSFISLIVNSDIRMEDSKPFPWNIKSHRNHFWLTNSFSLFKKRYEYQVLRRFLNLVPQNAWSPLCRAASLGWTRAMESLVCMGAGLDVEGSTVGSALIVACTTGQKASVVWLVRRRAVLSYWEPSGFRSAYDAAKNNRSILDWLLVSRFVDQKKLTATLGHEPERESRHGVCTWSGPVRAELVICGTMERMSGESSKDYWSRLMREKEGLRGKVLPIGFARRTSRPSGLVAQEYVRVHPDGYEAKKVKDGGKAIQSYCLSL
ncbi:hypothetical protein LY78DRAFT_411829 [Colletotrichum sublineola]|nr:hypothetical protein LY78DRAFT_411829 [Colletotrichum sublineola]